MSRQRGPEGPKDTLRGDFLPDVGPSSGVGPRGQEALPSGDEPDQHWCMFISSRGLDYPSRWSRSRVANLLGLAGLALMIMAVARELRKPPAERSWHGEVLGFVPYDLRPPTVSRLRESVWQPESGRWFLPRSLGVGWSPNLARIATLLRRRPRG